MDVQAGAGQRQPAKVQSQHGMAGSGMACHIGQRLLADAVEREPQHTRQPQRLRSGIIGPGHGAAVWAVPAQVQPASQARLGPSALPAVNQGLQQGHAPCQALCLRCTSRRRTEGLQPHQQGPDVLLHQRTLPGHAVHHRQQGRVRGQAARQPGGVHPQRRQPLAKLVVQITRQPGALVLLQRQHLLAELAALRLGLVQRSTQVAQRSGQ